MTDDSHQQASPGQQYPPRPRLLSSGGPHTPRLSELAPSKEVLRFGLPDTSIGN